MRGKKPLCGEFSNYYYQNFVVLAAFSKKIDEGN